MKVAGLPWVFALLSAAILVAAGFGAQFGLWDFGFGFQLVRWSEFTGLATAALAIIALVLPRLREGRRLTLTAALAIGLGVAYFPWNWLQNARAVPAINDITTDTDHPPAFVALVPLRAGSRVPTV